MSSSMKLLNDPISRHGLVVIPKQQISGIGNNTILFKFTIIAGVKLRNKKYICNIRIFLHGKLNFQN